MRPMRDGRFTSVESLRVASPSTSVRPSIHTRNLGIQLLLAAAARYPRCADPAGAAPCSAARAPRAATTAGGDSRRRRHHPCSGHPNSAPKTIVSRSDPQRPLAAAAPPDPTQSHFFLLSANQGIPRFAMHMMTHSQYGTTSDYGRHARSHNHSTGLSCKYFA